jgi:Ca2+-binding RTX toxin-like protein
MRWGVLVALVLGASTVAAAPASAADVTYDAGGMVITGVPGESSRLTVTFDPYGTRTVHDDAGGLRPGIGCIGTFSDVACGGLLTAACHPCTARIDLGDANDTLALAGTSEKGPFLVAAGAGDDDVHIRADTNAIVDGGPGRDTLRADTYSELFGGAGPDVIGGTATASYAALAAGVTVTLDGVANDGAPGEGDNVMTNAVIGSDGADTMTGNDAANDLSGRGGDDVLFGGGGADTLRGDGGAGRIDAGAGDDRVEATRGDAVKCGAGTDIALGLSVPGAYGDCETIFAAYESPYLTASDLTISKRRPRLTLGWHSYPGVLDFPETASGIVELRYRGKVIGGGTFSAATRPSPRAVLLRLNARGKALACRSARRVRLLVVAGGGDTFTVAQSAIRRDARLPRVGTCAKTKTSR